MPIKKIGPESDEKFRAGYNPMTYVFARFLFFLLPPLHSMNIFLDVEAQVEDRDDRDDEEEELTERDIRGK